MLSGFALVENEDSRKIQYDQQHTESAEGVANSGLQETGREVIEVRSAKELFEAIGSNRIIRVMTDIIDISENTYYSGVKVKDVYNLTIEGVDPKYPVDLYVDAFDSPASNAFTFEDSENIELINLRIGHYPEMRTACMTPVLSFRGCKYIRIKGCVLYGCGTEGIDAVNTHDFKFENSTIESCKTTAVSLNKCTNFTFSHATIAHNRTEEATISIRLCEDIAFNHSRIYDNIPQPEYIVLASESGPISFDECIAEDNLVLRFLEDGGNSWVNLNLTSFKILSPDEYRDRFDVPHRKKVEESCEADPAILARYKATSSLQNEEITKVLAKLYNRYDPGDHPEEMTFMIHDEYPYPISYIHYQEGSPARTGTEAADDFQSRAGYLYHVDASNFIDYPIFDHPLIVSQKFMNEFTIVPMLVFSQWHEGSLPGKDYQKAVTDQIRAEVERRANAKVMTKIWWHRVKMDKCRSLKSILSLMMVSIPELSS